MLFLLQIKTLPVGSPAAVALGAVPLKPEKATNFSAGIVLTPAPAISVTIYAYQIEVKDRIALTSTLTGAPVSAILVAAGLSPDISAQYFTNAIDTRTRGADFVATYSTELVDDARLALSLAASYNDTEVVRQRPTPAPILVGATARGQSLQLLDQTSVELIEVAIPKVKVLGGVTLGYKAITATARGTYFGAVKAFSNGLSPLDRNVECDAAARCVQTFAGKAIFDFSLSVKLFERLNLTAGANNIFNTYPDKYNNRRGGFVGEAASYSNGQVPYSRNSNQFGFNGAYYFVAAAFGF